MPICTDFRQTDSSFKAQTKPEKEIHKNVYLTLLSGSLVGEALPFLVTDEVLGELATLEIGDES